MVDKPTLVMAAKDDEEVKAEGWGHVVEEGSMAKGGAESHPIREKIRGSRSDVLDFS